MAYRRRRRSRRRRYGRKRRGRSKRLTVIRTPGLFAADKTMVRLKKFFEAEIEIAGAVYSKSFSGNSAFDVLNVGGASQATGFDQWCAFFGVYVVRASKIYVFIQNMADDQGLMCHVTPIDTVTFGFPDTAPERRSTHTFFVGPKSGGQSSKKIKYYQTSDNMFGRKRGDDALALCANNPSVRWYWNVHVKSADAGATSTNFAFNLYVVIKQYVTFLQKNRELAGS